MCIFHCIASHCVKRSTFLFETEYNKDVGYLRSTISQERLDGLALITIETKAADLLDSFANNKGQQCKVMASLQLMYILCVLVRPTNSLTLC